MDPSLIQLLIFNVSSGLGLVFIIITFIVFIILLIILLFYRYKKQVAYRQINALNKQLEKYSKENYQYKTELNKLVELKAGDLHHELANQEQKRIQRTIELKKEKENTYLKNAFLSSMSLEIRTPLSSIISFTKLLQTELSILDKPDLYEYSKGIADSSENLLNLLDNLIDINKADARDFIIKPTVNDINSSINKVVNKFMNKAQQKGLLINILPIKISPFIFDADIIEKTISLLLDNAINYTNKGFINISVKLSASSNIVIKIKDTGQGIDTKFLDNIFNPYRKESLGYRELKQGRTGLGLPLAKRLSKLIEGDLHIESEIGKSTSVLFSFPYMKADNSTSVDDPKKSTTQKTHSSFTKRPNIFIVEDDKMNRLVFKKMLEKVADLKICEDGDIALDAFSKHLALKETYDIILMDINLPAPWDGINVMKEMKSKHKEALSIPFVAQTAYAMSGDKERLLKEGFDDYISKPIDKQELFHIIETNIKN